MQQTYQDWTQVVRGRQIWIAPGQGTPEVQNEGGSSAIVAYVVGDHAITCQGRLIHKSDIFMVRQIVLAEEVVEWMTGAIARTLYMALIGPLNEHPHPNAFYIESV